MDRKVRIVRFWLLMAVVAALVVLWPSVGIACWPLLGMMISTYKCCCPADCSFCNSGTVPDQYQVELSGISNQGCSDCTTLDGTYIIDRTAACVWSQAVSPAVCTFILIQVRQDSVLQETTVNFADPGLFGLKQIMWSKAGGASTIDCDAFSATDIPADVADDTSPDCDNGSSTCLLTAL